MHALRGAIARQSAAGQRLHPGGAMKRRFDLDWHDTANWIFIGYVVGLIGLGLLGFTCGAM